MNLGPLPANIYFGVAVGFGAVLLTASMLNKFGDELFKRGFVKPFFLGKHRVHHQRFLFVILPGGYSLLSFMVLLGLLKIVWSVFWAGLAATMVIGTGCLALDITLDYARGGEGWGFLHHELVYLAIPLFVFTNLVRFLV